MLYYINNTIYAIRMRCAARVLLLLLMRDSHGLGQAQLRMPHRIHQ